MIPLRLARSLASGLAVFVLAGCAGGRVVPDEGAALVRSDVPDEGRMRGVVINRRYGDVFHVDGRKVRRQIELAWDYDRGTAIKRIYDESGRLLGSEDLPGAEMRLTPAENDRVKALVRGYPSLKGVASRPGVVIWAGGFVLRQPGDRWCDARTRCIHAILSSDNGATAVAHAIVDLQRDRVVYPEYDMDQYAKKAEPHLGSR